MSEQAIGVSTPNTTTEGNDPVALLVGEGKKFKTVADLAKGKLASDDFVKQLQEENRALRELAAGKAEETNTTLLSELVASVSKGNTNSTPSATQANQPAKTGLTEEDVNALIEKRDAKTSAANNIRLYNETVSRAFADKAPAEVQARLNKVGADPEMFSQLVAKSPQAALALLGLEPSKSGANMGSREGSVNTEALLSNSNAGVKNAAYFRNLRKTMGSKYYDPAIQQDLFKQRKAMGEKFYE